MTTRVQSTSPLIRLRRMASPERLSVGLAVAVLLATELLGRRSQNDLQDMVALVVLILVFGATYLAFGEPALAWTRPVRSLARSLLGRLTAHRFEFGLDLRRDPPIARQNPALLEILLVALCSVAVVLVVLVGFSSLDYRQVATSVLYVGHLAFLAGLWSVLTCSVVASLLLPATFLHDAFANRARGRGWRRRHPEAHALVAYFGSILVAALLLPVWTPTALVGGALLWLCASTSRSTSPVVVLLWRRRGDATVHSLDGWMYELQSATLLALVFLILLLCSLGRQAIGIAPPGTTDMPVTNVLGLLTAWLGGSALAAAAVYASWWVRATRRVDPARPAPTVIHVRGHVGRKDEVRGLFARHGWRTRFAPADPAPTDVQIDLLESPMPVLGRPLPWPLPVSRKGLEVPELIRLLARRDQIQRRRRLVGGFEQLFKRAAGHRFRRGRGFWLAPHYWFISGMTRDGDEDELDAAQGTLPRGIIGPAYRRVFSQPVRAHFHEVLRAVQVDLLYVEDGVGFRGFRRVLRVLFEHYDIHGDRLRIENRHFFGLPRLRVFLHDYLLGQPLRKTSYPEPDYDMLARARILHVYKDRGENPEPALDPIDLESLPLPVGGVPGAAP